MTYTTMSLANQGEEASPQQLVLRVLSLVTEVMVDDVALAEQMRMAAMTIWLAQHRTQDAGLCWVAWRDIRRGEQQLRRQLYQALRLGYLAYEQFDEMMTLLRELVQPTRHLRSLRGAQEQALHS